MGLSVPRAVKHYVTNSVQAGSLHTSSLEMTLSQNTNALVVRASGNSHSYYWPDPSSCPWGKVSRSGVETFEVGDRSGGVSANFEIPFHLADGMAGIIIAAKFVGTGERQILIAPRVVECGDTAFQGTGDYNDFVPRTPILDSNWKSNSVPLFSRVLWFYMPDIANMTMDSGSWPSSDRFAIRFVAQLAGTYDPISDVMSSTHEIYLQHVSVVNTPDEKLG
jgi:hypothetical protein